MNKTESAALTISTFNEFCQVKCYKEHLTPQNAATIISDGWDIIMDGSDNAKTRYLINDTCMILHKPLVSGSALKWEGQLTIYGYQDGPCYRCLFPIPTPAHCVQNCSDGGVVGMIPGIIGQLQALEIVKLILGRKDEEVLCKRMVLFDGLRGTFKTVKIRGKREDCAVCGKNPTVTDVKDFDYDAFVGTPKCDITEKI